MAFRSPAICKSALLDALYVLLSFQLSMKKAQVYCDAVPHIADIHEYLRSARASLIVLKTYS